MIDAIKKKSLEHGALAQDLFNQIVDWKTKHDELQKEYINDMMSLHEYIEMQGHDEALIQGQLISLQDRM
eukprot:12930703-Prorocentrum_lima.AAC.1